MRKVTILLFLLATLSSIHLSAQCTASGDPAVKICMPADGATSLHSPLHLQIGTNDSMFTVDLLQVYYNQVKRWEEHVASADFFLATGNAVGYRITAVAHDTGGRWFSTTINVTVTGQTLVCTGDQVPSPAPPHTMFICQPTDGEIHYSPVHLTWYAPPANGQTLQAVQIFVDGVSMFSTPPFKRNGFAVPATDLPMSIGRHRITIQAYDGTTPYKSTIYMHVSKIAVGCAPPAILPDINLCSLTDGEVVSSPVLIRAASAANAGIDHMQIWVDGTLLTTYYHPWLDQGIDLAAGVHTIEIRAIEANGSVLSKTVHVTVQ